MIPGIKEKAIDSYIKNNGDMGNARDSVKKELKKNILQFQKLYESNRYTIVEIEKIMDCSKDTIRKYAKALGIEITQPNRLNQS